MNEEERGPVAVVGAGSWGTALAHLLGGKGVPVRLWSFEEEVVREIHERRENSRYLPGIALPAEVEATHAIDEAVHGADLVISVSPSHFVRETMERAAPHIRPDALVVSASKGLEVGTLLTMDQVLAAILPKEQGRTLSVISGPSFAVEVARECPTAVVVASRSAPARERVQRLFRTEYFRVYTNPDVVGVELGGALKNVIALGAGVAVGLGFGHNTLAALLTRGLAEIRRLGLAMGASRATFAGLAGLGDLVLTCTGDLSRNRTVGFRLGRGESLEAILGEMDQVAEGVRTVVAAVELAARHGVEMPIAGEVHAILHEGREPREALRSLMMRDPKPEEWS